METGKTKKELYMERLEKWRKEKQQRQPLSEKNKHTNLKVRNSELVASKAALKTLTGKRTSYIADKTTTRGPTRFTQNVPARSGVGPQQDRRSTVTAAVNRKPIQVVPNKTGRKTENPALPTHKTSTVKPTTHSNTGKPGTDSQQDRRAPITTSHRKSTVGCSTGSKQPLKSKPSKEEEAEMLEKLRKWKEEKNRSTKKCPVYSVKKDRPKLKEVKSRLFDFMSTKASGDGGKVTQTKPYRNSPLNGNSRNQNGVRGALKSPATKTKLALKRRHSEVLKTNPVKKPASILKRKSCIGSLSDLPQLGTEVKSAEDITGDSDPVFITPGLSRSVRFRSPEDSQNEHHTLRKTPVRLPVKTQASMRLQLDRWMKAKGHTPSKFRHLTCFDAEMKDEKNQDPKTKPSLTTEELQEQFEVIEYEKCQQETEEKLAAMLTDCTRLVEDGCPTEHILAWLENIYMQIPHAQVSAQFYICKANALKSTLNLDDILTVFETALVNKAEPREDLARAMSEVIKTVTEEREKRARTRTRTPRKSLVQTENIFQSSTVMYTVSNATPIGNQKTYRGRRRSTTDAEADGCKVVTPVRRSTRRSLHLPESLRDKSTMYASLEDVDPREKENMLFKPNIALDSLLASADEADSQ